MKQSKERAGDERNRNRAGDGGEETIGNERIQANLLQQTKRHVPEEASRNENVMERVILDAEKQTRNSDGDGAWKKDE